MQRLMFSPPDYSAPENFLRPRLGPWTVLLYLHRKPILDAVLEAAPNLKGMLLDVGCGNKPYRTILNCEKHVGVDVASSPHDNAHFDYTYDGLTLGFDEATFDSVMCTEVLEHCKDPRRLMREISRVLRPGGHALVTVPFFIHHHEEPHDFQRFTRYGMEELAAQAGLTVVWLKPRGGVYSTFIAALYLALSQTLSRRPFIDLLLWTLWPFTALGIKLERFRIRSAVMSLGWQMLLTKTS